MNVLVAGATGAVGTVLVPRLRAAGFEVVPHVRPKTAAKHAFGADPQALVTDLSDTARLDPAIAAAKTVICLVGTMRKRFAAGDTYESSDYQPVVQLAESARRAGGRHFILLTSYGARQGPNAYLQWKWRAEQALRGSGNPWTILRPSALDGVDRKPPPLFGGAVRGLGAIPGLKGFSLDLRPMPIETLAQAIVYVTRQGGPTGAVLTGRDLWAIA